MSTRVCNLRRWIVLYASVADNWVGLGIAVLVIAYLVLVLIFPERF